MRCLTAAIVSLLLVNSSPAAAFPSSFSFGYSSQIAPHDRQRGSWRRLSDAIIRKIWKLPEAPSSLDLFAQAASNRGSPAGRWVARYGEDVVLRFTLGTPEEAAALAEAANVLILDVWEFNADWVDIRVAKDVVSVPGASSSHAPLH